MKWKLGDKHKYFGKVIMMRTIEGEPYRFFKEEDGSISMIPLSALKWNSLKDRYGDYVSYLMVK